MKMYSSIVKIGNTNRRMVVVNHNETDEELAVESITLDAVHHIHVLDRSGSMTCDINELIDGVQATIDIVDENDLITIIWFSGEGQCRTIIKGAKKSEQLKSVVNSLRSTIGMTSFLGPLDEINTIIEEIGSLAKVSVNFFTDGNPQNYESDILKKIAIISPKIVALNTIGYGNYYNQDLLKKMASASEFGSFVHSSDLAGFADIFSHNYEKINGVKAESLLVDSLGSASIMYSTRKFSKMSGRQLQLSKIDSQKNQIVLFGDDSSDFLFEYNGSKVDSASIEKAIRKDTVAATLYTMAARLYSQNARDESLEILAELGDKPLIDSHFKSFSYAERAVHQELLDSAATSTKGRNPGSAPENYIPAEDAFCLLDLLNILDKTGCKYYPLSKNVSGYKRIGREISEGYNTFKANDEEVSTDFSKLTWNKEQLNLSIQFSIKGIVKLNPNAAKNVGLPESIESARFKNYTIVKDGALNITSIEVEIPESARESVLSSVKYTVLEKDGRYVIDLSSIPIINKTYASKSITIKDIYDITIKVTDLEAKQKVVNYFIDQFEDTAAGAKVGKFASYTVDQIKVLEEHGLNSSLNYSGIDRKVESAEDSDYYEARVMKFTLAGFSSLPAVKEVKEKMGNGKPLSGASLAIQVHLEALEPLFTDTKKATLAKFLEIKKEVAEELYVLRNKMAGIKLAKVLTGGWFEGIETDSKNKSFYQPSADKVRMEVVSSYKKVYF